MSSGTILLSILTFTTLWAYSVDDIFFSYFSQKIGSDILYKLSPSLEEMSKPIFREK